MARDFTERKRAKEVIREWKDRYELIVAASGQVAYDYDLATGAILWGRTMEKVLGYGPDECVGGIGQWLDWLHPQDREETLRKLHEAEAACSFMDTRYRLRHKKGRDVWIRDRGFFVPDATGRAARQLGMLEDITAAVQTQEALRQNEAKYLGARQFSQLLLDTSPALIAAIGLDGKTLMMNPALLDLLEYSAEEIQGTDYLTTFIPAENRAGLAELFRRIVTDDKMTINENHVISKSGRTHLVEWHGRAVIHRDTGVGFFVGVGIDITERKKAETILHESEEKYRTLIENINIGVFRTAIKGEILIHANQALADIFGHKSVNEIIGLTIMGYYASEEERRDAIQELRTRGFLRDRLVRFKKRDGEVIVCSINAAFAHDETGAPKWVDGVIEDITERKRSEEELRAAREQLVQADKMIALGTLVAGVAHEINNPNNIVMLNTPLIQNAWKGVLPVLEAYCRENGDFKAGGMSYSKLREGVPTLLNGILDGARRINGIVKELKEFARPDEVSMNQKVEINAVVKASATLMQNVIAQSTESFKVTYGENLPALTGNRQRLEQVVINLIHNACQALPDSTRGIEIVTSRDERHVIVSVRDEGRGIPKAFLSQITNPFFTTRRGSGGTGLGLSVSRRIIADHGGRLSVESAEGKGSTFTVHLPLLPAAGKKKKILIIDDDAGLCDMMHHILSENPAYDVMAVKSGTEACIMLGKWNPDLIMLDINMPDMNGVEVCRTIKSNADFSAIKVIIATGFAVSAEMAAIRKMGFSHLLPKPFRRKELEDIIAAVLDNKGARR